MNDIDCPITPPIAMHMTEKTFLTFKPAAIFTLAMSVFVLLLAGCVETDGTGQAVDTLATDTTAFAADTAGLSSESIYALIHGDDRFSTFAAAIDSADLDQTLSGPGPFTVFAPTNQAIGQFDGELLQVENEDELRDLLLSHISNGEMMVSDLSGQTVRTLAGGDVRVSGSGDSLRVGDARVVEADIHAANGVIHAVEKVLAPSMQDEAL